MIMKGNFYDLDDWLNMVEEKRRENSAEGAKWWLGRIKSRSYT